jgi:TolA-binding protein
MRESDAIDHCAWQTKRIRELEQQLARANSRIAELQTELERLRKLASQAAERLEAEGKAISLPNAKALIESGQRVMKQRREVDSKSASSCPHDDEPCDWPSGLNRGKRICSNCRRAHPE